MKNFENEKGGYKNVTIEFTWNIILQKRISNQLSSLVLAPTPIPQIWDLIN